MKHLLTLLGPQIYGTSGNKADKYIEVNISINRLRNSPVVNFTGYTWCDQKYGFGMSLLRNSRNKIVVHDSDYLGMQEYAELLKAQGHEVVFVLSPHEYSWKRAMSAHPLSECAASNKRIRKAYEALKAAGVKVRKFQDLSALTRYLDAKHVATGSLPGRQTKAGA